MEFNLYRQFVEGWRVAKTVDVLTSRYRVQSIALNEELRKSGITPNKYRQLAITSMRPSSLAFSLGGATYCLLHGGISRIEKM